MKNDDLEIKCNLQNKSNWNYAWVMHRSREKKFFCQTTSDYSLCQKIQSDKSFPY